MPEPLGRCPRCERPIYDWTTRCECGRDVSALVQQWRRLLEESRAAKKPDEDDDAILRQAEQERARLEEQARLEQLARLEEQARLEQQARSEAVTRRQEQEAEREDDPVLPQETEHERAARAEQEHEQARLLRESQREDGERARVAATTDDAKDDAGHGEAHFDETEEKTPDAATKTATVEIAQPQWWRQRPNVIVAICTVALLVAGGAMLVDRGKRPPAIERMTAPQIIASVHSDNDVIAEGERRLSSGARDDGMLLLEFAADRGSVKAMAALARLYDPVLHRPGAPPPEPDALQAAKYYRAAEAAGDLTVVRPRAALRARLRQLADTGDSKAELALKEFWP